MKSEFVRLSDPERVYGQRNLLHSQLEVLNLVKSFSNYNKLRKEEFELKVALKSKIGEVYELIDSLENKLPKSDYKIPKTIKSNFKEQKEKKQKLNVQEEMLELQEKLRRLQSGM